MGHLPEEDVSEARNRVQIRLRQRSPTRHHIAQTDRVSDQEIEFPGSAAWIKVSAECSFAITGWGARVLPIMNLERMPLSSWAHARRSALEKRLFCWRSGLFICFLGGRPFGFFELFGFGLMGCWLFLDRCFLGVICDVETTPFKLDGWG